jgi:hypothetical protein
LVVGAPAWLGDSEPPGVAFAEDCDGDGEGDALPDCEGLCDPDGDGEPDDGDGDSGDGDADCGEGDCGGGDPDCDDGGGVVGSGGGASDFGDWLNIRIARRIASIAMRIIISQDARIETRPARSWRPGHGSGHSRDSPGCTRSIQCNA